MGWDALRIETPRGLFAVRTAGEPGQPLVVCLHGFLDDAGTFDDLLCWLGGHGFYAIAPYQRGYSPTPLPFVTDDCDVRRELSADLLALCDVVSPRDPATLVSLGEGTTIALDAIQRDPDRFSRAAYLGSGVMDVPWHVRRSLRRNGPNKLEAMWRRWSTTWNPSVTRMAEVINTLEVNWPAPLKWLELRRRMRVDAPIRTPSCHFISEREATRLRMPCNFTGEFREVIVPGARHFLHLEQPQFVARALVEWLATDFARFPLPSVPDITADAVIPEASIPRREGQLPLRSRSGST